MLTPKTDILTIRRVNGTETLQGCAALLQEAHLFNRESSKLLVLLGGNEHNARFMAVRDTPFDFFHSRYPGLIQGRQIVPAACIRDVAASDLRPTRVKFRFLAEQFPVAQKIVVAPPPPIPSADHIRRFPEIFDFAQHPLEDASVRLKIYDIYLDTLSHCAAEAGMRFIAPPGECRDRDGYLLERYWNQCTHATADYYDPVLKSAGIECHASV
jgi:hypothetical protein